MLVRVSVTGRVTAKVRGVSVVSEVASGVCAVSVGCKGVVVSVENLVGAAVSLGEGGSVADAARMVGVGAGIVVFGLSVLVNHTNVNTNNPAIHMAKP